MMTTTRVGTEEIDLCRIDCRHQFLVNGLFWIHAVRGGQVIGSVSLGDVHGWAWINDLFVAETYRRRGIGRLLLEKVTEAAKEILPDLPVAAGVRLANEASQGLFKSCGWGIDEEYAPGVALMTPPCD